METTWIQSPVGWLEIKGTEAGIACIRFGEPQGGPLETVPPYLATAVTQLKEYFRKQRTHFELDLNPQGTAFQQKVWRQLQTIPFGTTSSYQRMANQLGDPNVVRAAASANGKNPIAIVIPCHRVIGSDGSLTGYAGGLHRKKWLLQHESPTRQTGLFD